MTEAVKSKKTVRKRVVDLDRMKNMSNDELTALLKKNQTKRARKEEYSKKQYDLIKSRLDKFNQYLEELSAAVNGIIKDRQNNKAAPVAAPKNKKPTKKSA